MVVTILGVLEDGTPRAAGVPLDPGAPLRMPLGGSATINVSIVGSNGVPVPVVDGDVFTLGFKKRPSEGPLFAPKIGVPVPSVPGTVVQFTFAASDTRYLTSGQYVYDVWRTRGDAQDRLVPVSLFQLLPVATMPPPST